MREQTYSKSYTEVGEKKEMKSVIRGFDHHAYSFYFSHISVEPYVIHLWVHCESESRM